MVGWGCDGGGMVVVVVVVGGHIHNLTHNFLEARVLHRRDAVFLQVVLDLPFVGPLHSHAPPQLLQLWGQTGRVTGMTRQSTEVTRGTSGRRHVTDVT